MLNRVVSVISFLVFFLLFAVFILVITSSPYIHGQQAYTKAENHNAQPKDEPFGEREASATETIATFTIVLAVANALLFGVSVIQLGFIRRAEDIASRNAAAAKASADAAKLSAEANIAQMRAYVSVAYAKIYGFDEDGESRVLIRIGNTGATAAFDVTGEYGVTIREAEVFSLKGDLRPKDHPPIFRSRAGMGPKTTFDTLNVIPAMVLTPELKAAIRARTVGIFAYGEIRYRDALKNPWRTTYRLMYGGAVGADPDGKFVTCEEGNDSD